MRDRHEDVFGDLLTMAERISGSMKTARYESGDDVHVKLPAGSFDGTFMGYNPDGVRAKVQQPSGREVSVPLSSIQSPLEMKQKIQDVKDRFADEISAEEEEARKASTGKMDLTGYIARKRQRDLGSTQGSAIDAFAELLRQAGVGSVRVHWGPRGQHIAEGMFQNAGYDAPPYPPYEPGTEGGNPEGMYGVQGVTQFIKQPGLDSTTVPAMKGYKDLGNRVEINNTSLAFELVRRGFEPKP